MINLLSNYSFVKPNVNNALEDFVEGNSHLSGKILTEGSDASDICVDPDQINVKYASKKCNTDSTNKCLDDKGLVLKPGDTFNYTIDCNSSPCDGQVGCISLNYHSIENNINLDTRCISIEGISVGEKTGEIYDLSFFREINIINNWPSIPQHGPFPINLGFNICDNTDARQKFKLTRHVYLDGTDPTKPGVSGFVPDPTGNYSSIIFRGLNSYLDMGENGSFVLREIKNDPKEGIKWILFPESNLMKKTVPSLQRCAALRANMEGKTGASGLLGGRDSLVLGQAGLVVKGVGKVLSMRKSTILTKTFNYLKNLTKTDQEKFYAQFKRAPWAAAEEETAAARAGKAISSVADVIESADPSTWILIILTLIALFIPNPSYADPPILSYGIKKNTRVGPTNFLGQVTDLSAPADPDNLGQGNVTPIEQFCLKRELPTYPPYFLECLSDGLQISTQYINYGYERGYSISASNVLNVGTEPAEGLYIWNNENNLGGVSGALGSVWQDGDTVWAIRNTLSEAIIYDPLYFTSTGVSSVTDFTLHFTLSGATSNYSEQVQPPSGFTKSKTGLITSINLKNKNTVTDMNKNGRLAGIYLATDSHHSPAGTSAKFAVNVDYSPVSLTENSTKITEIAISDRGSDYKTTDIINLDYTDIGGSNSTKDVSFGVSAVGIEVFNFLSLPYYGKDKSNTDIYLIPGSGTTYTEDSKTYTVQSQGFEIAATNINTGNNKTTVTFNKILQQRKGDVLPTGILSGGEGYSVGETLYLAQYDIVGNLLSPIPANTENRVNNSDLDKNFIKLKVYEVSSPGYGVDDVAPHNLYENSSFNLEYNFMDNSENIFASSPQQIVYGGYTDKFITDFAKNFKGNLTSDNVYQYFLSSSSRDQTTGLLKSNEELSPLKLKSIQINEFKYQKTSIDVELAPPPVSSNKEGNIILGKFIPYQYFSPATGEAEASAGFQLGYKAEELYTNWNYAQFIPFGVQDIYVNKNFAENPPKF